MMTRAQLPQVAVAMLLTATLLLLSATGQAQAPSKRTVLGQVLDENDKVAPTAVVHLINLSTKEHLTAVTDKQGRYQFNAVDMKADFQIYAERGEQKSPTRRISQFDTRTRVVVNLKLEPAKKSEENQEKKD